MSPKRPETFGELLRRWGADEAPAVRSINSLVARNLTAARTLRGMTQERLGQRLEEITGRPWSKATVSALERSADGERVRQFDADDLAAIAYALDVPLLFLFLPDSPDYHPHVRYAPRPVPADSVPSERDWTAADLVRLLIGAGDATATVGAGDAAAYVASALAELVGIVEAQATERLVTDVTARKLARWRDTLDEMATELTRAVADRSGRGKR